MDTKREDTPLIEVVNIGSRETTSPFLRWTPVEILVVLHTLAIVALGPVQSYYVIDETAKKHGQHHINRHSDTSCHPLNSSNISHVNDSSLIIQKEATEVLMYLGLCSSLGSVVPIFLIGYLTDFFGRRMVWIMAVCGTIAKELILLLTVVCRWPIWVLYIGQIVFALSGTYGGSMVPIFATVADVTSPGKSRAFRITVVQGTGMLTAAVTIYVMGYWIWTEKYVGPVQMALCISVVSGILGRFILKPSNVSRSERKEILAPLKIYGRNKHTKWKMLLCLFIFSLSSSCLIGKLEYQTLFLMHAPICWNEFNIQVMHAVQTLLNTICVIGIVRLLLRYTQDMIILVFGSISGIVSMLIFGFAVNSTMVYLHVVFGFVSIAVFPVMRATMSKYVEPHEQGSLFASIACLDELVAAVSGLIYGKLYTASVGWFPGFIFVLMVGLFCCTFVGSLVLVFWTRHDSRQRSDIQR